MNIDGNTGMHDIRQRRTRLLKLFVVLSFVVLITMMMRPGFVRAEDTVAVVLAIVNDDTVSTADLDRQLIQLHTTMTSDQRQKFDYRKLLTKLVNDRVLVHEARALGMDDNPALLEKLHETWDRQAIGLYAREHFKPDLDLEEDSVQAYFKKFYSHLQLRTVTVRTRAEAEEIAAAIRAGARMDSIALAMSLDLYRYGGGLHKNKYYHDVERLLRDPSDTMQVGRLSAPLPFQDAFALLRVESRTPADPADLENHRAKIEGELKFQAQNRQWEEFIAALGDTYPVTTDQEGLDAIRADADSLFTPRFMQGSDRPVLSGYDDVQITDRQLRRMVSRAAMEAARKPFDSLLADAVRLGREELVLKAAAFAEGYQNRPAITRGYAASFDSAMVEAYLQETVVPQIKFKHAELDQYYHEHAAEFTTSPACQFQQMTLPDDSTAEKAYARLKEGADFLYIGKQFGAELSSPEAAAEWINLETFPATIGDEIKSLRIGQVTPPYAVSDGWLILKLKGFRAGSPKPMSDVEPTIKARIFQQKFDQILDQTLSVLKEHSSILYNEQNIKTYFGTDS